MKNKQRLRLSTAIALAFVLSACAVFRSTSKGPADLFAPRTPKALPIVDVGPLDSNDLLNYRQSNLLMNLTTDQAKAIVIDQSPWPYHETDLFTDENKRLTVSYVAPSDDLDAQSLRPTGPFNHSVFVVGAMMNDHSYVLHPGFMGKHGLVHLISYQKYNNQSYVLSPYRYDLGGREFEMTLSLLSDEPIQWAKKGYIGLNASWGAGINLSSAAFRYWVYRRATSKASNQEINDEINQIIEKYPEYQAIAHLILPVVYSSVAPLPTIPYVPPASDRDYEPPSEDEFLSRRQFSDELLDAQWKMLQQYMGLSNAALDRFQYLATEYDVNVTLSAGNSGNNSGHTMYSLTPMRLYADLYLPDGQRRWRALSESMLVVASQNTYRFGGRYSNTCAATPEFCVTAYGWAYARNVEDATNLKNGPFHWRSNPAMETGTSFAAPYTQSVVQMVRSVFPFFNNKNAQITVLTTAKQTQPGERINLNSGWGLVQPQAAVNGPAMFWARDFEANFTHYPQWIARYGVYSFSNDINGHYGLVVTGNAQLQPVLSLAGTDSYEGDTVVQSHGILYVPGSILTSRIRVDASSQLIADGQVASVDNEGLLVSYAPALNKAFKFKPRNKNTYATGLLITGDLQQGQKATVAVALGKPLLVKGQAQLAGTLRLDVAAFADAADTTPFAQLGQLEKGLVMVMVSERPFKGQFDRVVSADPNITVTGRLVVGTKLVNGKTVYTLSVPVKVKPVAKADEKADKPADKADKPADKAVKPSTDKPAADKKADKKAG